MIKSIKVFFILFLIIFSSAAPAKQIKKAVLSEYIKKVCPKKCIQPKDLLIAVKRNSKKYNIDYKILLALIKVESSFNIYAKNGSSVGLTQVLLRYHKPKFTGNDYYHIDDNISVGSQILGACYKRSKNNVRYSLQCYNGGGDKSYSIKVMKAYKEISFLNLEL